MLTLGFHAIAAAPIASGPDWPHPMPTDMITIVAGSAFELAGEGPVLEMLRNRRVERAWAATLELHFLSDKVPT